MWTREEASGLALVMGVWASAAWPATAYASPGQGQTSAVRRGAVRCGAVPLSGHPQAGRWTMTSIWRRGLPERLCDDWTAGRLDDWMTVPRCFLLAWRDHDAVAQMRDRQRASLRPCLQAGSHSDASID